MQCEYMTSVGQCSKDAVNPGRFCPDHSATSTQTIINQYRIANSFLGESIERHAQSTQLKSVAGEIVILRSLLEKKLNLCESDAEVVAAIPAIQGLAVAVEKLATSYHTMDVKLGNLLGKHELMSLAQKIIGIISTHVRPFENVTPSTEDVDEALETVGQEIVSAIASMEKSE